MPATRWEQFKSVSFYTALVLLVVGPVFLASPAGPAVLKWYIHKENPEGQPVKPWATEWMFTLGRYYSITLNDAGAKATYKEMFQWYRDRKTRKIDPEDPWVGRALFYDAKILQDTSHDLKAKERYKQFLRYFGDNPRVPDDLKNMARTRAGIFREDD